MKTFICSLQLLFKNRSIKIMVKDISYTKNKPTLWEAIEDEYLFEDVRDTGLGREVDLS